jgi:hypothetical protein
MALQQRPPSSRNSYRNGRPRTQHRAARPGVARLNGQRCRPNREATPGLRGDRAFASRTPDCDRHRDSEHGFYALRSLSPPRAPPGVMSPDDVPIQDRVTAVTGSRIERAGPFIAVPVQVLTPGFLTHTNAPIPCEARAAPCTPLWLVAVAAAEGVVPRPRSDPVARCRLWKFCGNRAPICGIPTRGELIRYANSNSG